MCDLIDVYVCSILPLRPPFCLRNGLNLHSPSLVFLADGELARQPPADGQLPSRQEHQLLSIRRCEEFCPLLDLWYALGTGRGGCSRLTDFPLHQFNG